MSDFLDDRRRALEEDYFRRKEQETLARLREKMKTENAGQELSAAESAVVRCPRDGAEMVTVMFDDVEVDRCATCGGLWLDAGELEQLTQRDVGGGFFNRMRQTLVGE